MRGSEPAEDGGNFSFVFGCPVLGIHYSDSPSYCSSGMVQSTTRVRSHLDWPGETLPKKLADPGFVPGAVVLAIHAECYF